MGVYEGFHVIMGVVHWYSNSYSTVHVKVITVNKRCVAIAVAAGWSHHDPHTLYGLLFDLDLSCLCELDGWRLHQGWDHNRCRCLYRDKGKHSQ